LSRVKKEGELGGTKGKREAEEGGGGGGKELTGSIKLRAP